MIFYAFYVLCNGCRKLDTDRLVQSHADALIRNDDRTVRLFVPVQHASANAGESCRGAELEPEIWSRVVKLRVDQQHLPALQDPGECAGAGGAMEKTAAQDSGDAVGRGWREDAMRKKDTAGATRAETTTACWSSMASVVTWNICGHRPRAHPHAGLT